MAKKSGDIEAAKTFLRRAKIQEAEIAS